MLNKLIDYNDKDSLVNRIRNARFQFFEQRLKKLGPGRIRLLDVGGFERFWENRGYVSADLSGVQLEITLLNLEAEQTHYPNMTSVKGNACDMREFPTGRFDVVFSNSVIEHLHSFESQRAMASEVLRVGRHHFVQTPNRMFPIEPHFLLPFFQFMPRSVQHTVLTKTALSRRFKHLTAAESASVLDEIRLLRLQEFATLFPKSEMYEEKFFGMTKSFTAHNM